MKTLYCKRCEGKRTIRINIAATGRCWNECTACNKSTDGTYETEGKALAKWVECNPEPQPKQYYCNHCKTNCDLLPYQDKVMAMATGVSRWAVKCRKCNHTTRFCDRVAEAYEIWDKDNPHPAEPGSEATPLKWETQHMDLYCKYCNAERTIEIREEPHCYSMWCSQCSATVSRVNTDTQPTEEEMRELWAKHNQKPKTMDYENYSYCAKCKCVREMEISERQFGFKVQCKTCAYSMFVAVTNKTEALAAWITCNPEPKPEAKAGCGPPAPHTVEDTLKVRIPTNGNLPDQAQCSQELKDVVRRFQMSWSRLTHCQREALDMILHKIGRVIAGNADHADHWHDIAGYATLVEQEIAKGNVRITPTL